MTDRSWEDIREDTTKEVIEEVLQLIDKTHKKILKQRRSLPLNGFMLIDMERGIYVDLGGVDGHIKDLVKAIKEVKDDKQ